MLVFIWTAYVGFIASLLNVTSVYASATSQSTPSTHPLNIIRKLNITRAAEDMILITNVWEQATKTTPFRASPNSLFRCQNDLFERKIDLLLCYPKSTLHIKKSSLPKPAMLEVYSLDVLIPLYRHLETLVHHANASPSSTSSATSMNSGVFLTRAVEFPDGLPEKYTIDLAVSNKRVARFIFFMQN